MSPYLSNDGSLHICLHSPFLNCPPRNPRSSHPRTPGPGVARLSLTFEPGVTGEWGAGVDSYHFLMYYRRSMPLFRQNQMFVTTKKYLPKCFSMNTYLPRWVRRGEVWRFANLASQHCRPVSPGRIPRYLLNHRDKNYPPPSASPPILHVVYFQTKDCSSRPAAVTS